jgi:pantoate--beta-alanine ligase
MKIINTVKEMKRYAKHNNRRGRKIALVPTMGYFHNGHLMLIREARKRCDRLVVSIFVNPLQFGRGEDFATYPRNVKRDLTLARECRVNVIFAPSSEELYPPSYSTFIEEELLSKKLCGPFRPGHFKGVTTVVGKLLNIVRPHTVVFGQKDAQQAAIIKKMITDLNYPVRIAVMPTVREKSGLACSSRNKYLSSRERKEAAVIYRSLLRAKEEVGSGMKDVRRIIGVVKEVLSDAPLVRLEYLAAVNPDTLEHTSTVSEKTLIAIAARAGKTRLIDNIIVEP